MRRWRNNIIVIILFPFVALHASEKNKGTQEIIISDSYHAESELLLKKGAYLNLSKRLSINQVDPSVRMVPDDTPIIDRFASCKTIGNDSTSVDGVSVVMVWIDRDSETLKASYPSNYHCSFNRKMARKEISQYLIDYYLDRNNKQCDGRQLAEYVNNAIWLGSGVIKISKAESLGAGAISRAISSTNFNWYQNTLSDMRTHDLFLKRSGCNSLMLGPSTSDVTKLKSIRSQIDDLINQEINTSGFISESEPLMR